MGNKHCSYLVALVMCSGLAEAFAQEASSLNFFTQLQDKLNCEQIIDSPGSTMTAPSVLSYAEWLKARVAFLEPADQLCKKDVLIEKPPIPKEAEPYVATLKMAFAAQGMPEELIWLAEAESSFNPDARSSEGAAGLFQLMPDTAKSLGLSVWWPDDRLNAEKSAPAAAKYLKSMHERFKDWKLALAAYNAGPGRVERLMQEHNACTFEDVSSWLPTQTQSFVLKIEALLQKREGLTLSELAAPINMPSQLE